MAEYIRLKPGKCKACRRCEVACISAHYGIPFKEAMKRRDELTSRVRVVKVGEVKSTVRCRQCDPAPCCNVCPVGALRQAPDGSITMNEEQCVSCKMCVAVCPHGAVSLEASIGPAGDGEIAEADSSGLALRAIPVRCDMCRAWRIENGKKITACMEACPVRGLYIMQSDGTTVEMPEPEKKPAKESAE